MNEHYLQRTLHPETRVLDAQAGLVEYVASDETLDSYREVILASGWKFTHFAKNAPFVDSHDYSSIRQLLGQVVDFKVAGRKLIETVRWAKDVAENTVAQLGWKMTEAGFLKAVSVGFYPIRTLGQWSQNEDRAEYQQHLSDLKLDEKNVRAIYAEQEQIELSAVVIGANPNALARAFKAGVLNDADLDTFSARVAEMQSQRTQHPASPAAPAADAAEAIRQRQCAFLLQLHAAIARL